MESKQRFPATSAALADDERFVHHLPLHRVFVSAFSMNFEAIHQLAAPDQRRVGIAATVLGALVSILGGLIGFLLADIVGFSTK